jgi:hypothetical protein
MMSKRFRLGIGVMILCNVILGGLAVLRLFSWDSMVGADKFFYIVACILFVFGMYMAFLFSRLDSVPALPNLFERDVPNISKRDDAKLLKDGRDRELEELRKEKDRVPPYVPKPFVPSVPEPTGILRNSDLSLPIPPSITRLTDDVSMYSDRNILKPPVQQEYKVQEKSEYDNIF